MSLLTYSDARPWAKAMKAAVVTEKMPPWFADPNFGHFANDRRLSPAEIATLSSWADGGAPEGDKKDAPPAKTFQDGWNIKPDMIIEMPTDFQVKATGTINYQNILVKANFPEDTWVVAAEMRPGNAKVVHHMRAIVRPPGSTWLAKAIPGQAYEEGSEAMGGAKDGTDLLGKYNPGLGAQSFDVEGAAKFVPKGSDIVFNIHYTSVGTPQTDRSKVGLVFAKTPPQKRFWMSPGNPAAFNLVIPAGDSNAEVVSEITFGEPARLVYAQPHMHLRGKDFELRVVTPDKQTRTVLKGTWDFEWQQGYQYAEPVALPKGSKLQFITHFDNSPANRFNPDPKVQVVWGPQNWDEMSNCFIGVLFDKGTAPERVFLKSGPSMLARGASGPTLASFSLAGDGVEPVENGSGGAPR